MCSSDLFPSHDIRLVLLLNKPPSSPRPPLTIDPIPPVTAPVKPAVAASANFAPNPIIINLYILRAYFEEALPFLLDIICYVRTALFWL